MNSNPIKPPGKPKAAPLPGLDTMQLGGCTMVYFDSLLKAVGRDPASEPSDRPITVSKKEAARRIGRSLPTIDRMIRRGRDAKNANNQNTAA
jgi:hypothetical protein